MKKWLATGMAILLFGGVTGIIYATSAKANPTPVQSVSAEQHSSSMSKADEKDSEVNDDDQKQEENEQEVPDSVEQANLQKQVTITEADAQKRALEHQTGKVADVQLEEEDGQAVYNVQITDSNGQTWEVKIDGKTGSFIQSEQGDSEADSEDSD